MRYESPGVRLETDDGIATLWLAFAGSPVNALDLSRLEEIGRGIEFAVATPGVEILVIRSAVPAGFCEGLNRGALLHLISDAERAEFARTGQRVLAQLAAVPFPTLAFVHGPCLGVGLELALSCDGRLAVSGPDSAIGFPDATRGVLPCWGGTTRLVQRIGRKRAAELLHSGHILSGREAVCLGLFDDAFSERRAKIELRTALDRIQRTGALPGRRMWFRRRLSTAVDTTRPAYRTREFVRVAGRSQAEGEAMERARFAAAAPGLAQTQCVAARPRPMPAAVSEISVVGEWTEGPSELAGRAALRGGRVLVSEKEKGLIPLLDEYLIRQVGRGYVTPLEGEQARRRVVPSESVEEAALLLRAADDEITITVAGGGEFPIGLPLPDRATSLVEVGTGPLATSAALIRVTGWLAHLGFNPAVVADRPGLVVRRVLHAVFDEAVRLATEGVPADRIDAVGATICSYGGPLARLDRLGIGRVAGSIRRLMPLAATGLTFYRTGRWGRRLPNVEAAALLWDHRFSAAVAETDCNVVRPAVNLHADELVCEISDRLEYRVINEAARCLSNESFATVETVNGLVAEGAGLFVSAGGPLVASDIHFWSDCVAELTRLATRYGRRFAPAPWLVQRATERETLMPPEVLPPLRRAA